MPRPVIVGALAWWSALAALGCGRVGFDTRVDSGADAAVDTGLDAPIDTGVDAPFDAGADAPFDAGVDAFAPMDADMPDVFLDLDADLDASMYVCTNDASIDAAPSSLRFDEPLGDGGVEPPRRTLTVRVPYVIDTDGGSTEQKLFLGIRDLRTGAWSFSYGGVVDVMDGTTTFTRTATLYTDRAYETFAWTNVGVTFDECIDGVSATSAVRTILAGATDTTLSVGPLSTARPCALNTRAPADFDQNDCVVEPDIFAFLDAWFARLSSADIRGDGTVAVDDIFQFLDMWFTNGCGCRVM